MWCCGFLSHVWWFFWFRQNTHNVRSNDLYFEGISRVRTKQNMSDDEFSPRVLLYLPYRAVCNAEFCGKVPEGSQSLYAPLMWKKPIEFKLVFYHHLVMVVFNPAATQFAICPCSLCGRETPWFESCRDVGEVRQADELLVWPTQVFRTSSFNIPIHILGKKEVQQARCDPHKFFCFWKTCHQKGEYPFCMNRAADHLENLAAGSLQRRDPLSVARRTFGLS